MTRALLMVAGAAVLVPAWAMYQAPAMGIMLSVANFCR